MNTIHLDASNSFDVDAIIHRLAHYLPTQGPLKDFVHHNTLHAFQHLPFEEVILHARYVFEFFPLLPLETYRAYYKMGKIDKQAIQTALKVSGVEEGEWEGMIQKMLYGNYTSLWQARIGQLRKRWMQHLGIAIDNMINPVLFRTLSNFLDQGLSLWQFPGADKLSFLEAVRRLEQDSHISLFKTGRARDYLLRGHGKILPLLREIVGDEQLYEQYLFDTLFAHPGWSGMVSFLEQHPETLFNKRKISLNELIVFKLLLEIDALDYKLGEAAWLPLSKAPIERPSGLFEPVQGTELDTLLMLWQKSLEYTFYHEAMGAVVHNAKRERAAHKHLTTPSFQALFCIDDREESLRRYVEYVDKESQTFGTPGYFNMAFFYRPHEGQFHIKCCPAPMQPKHLVIEQCAIPGSGARQNPWHWTDPTTWRFSYKILGGWLAAVAMLPLSFWRLLKITFMPHASVATVLAEQHVAPQAHLTVEAEEPQKTIKGLSVGFSIEEMTERVEAVLKSIGLTHNFAPIVYVVAHGASSTNNPYFAGYDCGACAGRPGSVNARAFAYAANHPQVRQRLKERGIVIPNTTIFVPALHDTTRDEMIFYDTASLGGEAYADMHKKNIQTFEKALRLNAKERARRFANIPLHLKADKAYKKVQERAIDFMEVRPEYNHATNALCLIGSERLHRGLFLDRRAFLNSYDYTQDTQGQALCNILQAAVPVCGGINLEYFFSRMDPHKLGAGSKLPQNIMGLIGVTNGVEGDLRPGLPYQMVEIHDPLRILFIVEHYPEVVQSVIEKSPVLKEWFDNEWVILMVLHPRELRYYRYVKGRFVIHELPEWQPKRVSHPEDYVSSGRENLPFALLD